MATKQNLIFGVHAVLEKLKASPQDVIEILLSEVSDRAALRQIADQAARLRVGTVAASPNLLDQLVGGQRHQGVVARIEDYRYLPFGDLLEQVGASSGAERILILDGLTDPRNFGALLRAADGAGVRYVVIPKDRSVAATAVAVKASAGAAHHVKIARVTNLRRAILDLKKLDYWIVGLDASSAESIYDRSCPSRLAIVLGSEGKGVRPVILRECDFLVSIPMLGKVASLNVSVAGAVFLYELVRQRRSADTNLARTKGEIQKP
jgi:23S rRNA (guanosine2251-2'-O)-methyltransferase